MRLGDMRAAGAIADGPPRARGGKPRDGRRNAGAAEVINIKGIAVVIGVGHLTVHVVVFDDYLIHMLTQVVVEVSVRGVNVCTRRPLFEGCVDQLVQLAWRGGRAKFAGALATHYTPVTITDTTNSTSATTGAFTDAGGVAVAPAASVQHAGAVYLVLPHYVGAPLEQLPTRYPPLIPTLL